MHNRESQTAFPPFPWHAVVVLRKRSERTQQLHYVGIGRFACLHIDGAAAAGRGCTIIEAVARAGVSISAVDADAAGIHDVLWTLFSGRLVPVPDYYTPGNVLVHRILRDAPPGARIRAMGIQNIKGTGLDFIYRWQAWETHAAQSIALQGSNVDAALGAAQALAASTELGVLEVEKLQAAIAAARAGRLGQNEVMQSLLARIERGIAAGLEAVESYSDTRPDNDNRTWSWLMATAERILDAGDAVRRRRHADRVYADLVAGRIASARAAYELKQLTQRQKGGWLGA